MTLAPWAANAPQLDGWTHVYSGKVRDLYVPTGTRVAWQEGAAPVTERVLVVASNRLSAFDYVLDSEIPDKGEILTRMSLFWFEQLSEIVGHHVIADAPVPAAVAGRALVCHALNMAPIECVVRGYLTGSGLVEYKQDGTVCGLSLPAGLVESSQLTPPIYTPSRKADLGDHDENVSFERTAELVGTDLATELRETSLAVYQRAASIALKQGIIVADTKFEFGHHPATGALTLGDEVLTPDSSRFWDANTYQAGKIQDSFDKQIVRNWLTSAEAKWDRLADAPPPALPQEVIERTRARYIEAYERLTGSTF